MQLDLVHPGRRGALQRHRSVALGDRLGLLGDRGPAACSHTRWTSPSSVAGASRAVSDASAMRSGRGARRLMPRPCPAGRRRRATASRRHRRVLGARDVREVGRRDDALPGARQHLREQRAALGVELAHDVVEQHQRHGAPRRRQRLALGQQQRQQRQALLALRAVGAQLAPAAQQREVVAVRAVAGEAALEVRRRVLGELGGELGRVRRPASAACSAAAPRRRGRASLGDRREARREQVDRRRAVVAQRDRRGARARRPTPAASSASRARCAPAPARRCAA